MFVIHKVSKLFKTWPFVSFMPHFYDRGLAARFNFNHAQSRLTHLNIRINGNRMSRPDI